MLLFLIVVSCSFISCLSKNDKTVKQQKFLEITVERGAFHYDSFILKDSIIYFLPEKPNTPTKENDRNLLKYHKKSEQQISQYLIKEFILKLEQSNIWHLKENYACQNSCTSNLKVIIKLNDKQKVISCEDFKHDCPDILQYIENKIIELHGKNLYRIDLPG